MGDADRLLSDDVDAALKALGIARTRDLGIADDLGLLRLMEDESRRAADSDTDRPGAEAPSPGE